MTRAVLIPVDGPPQLVDIPDGDQATFRHLRDLFTPDAFDAIRLDHDVLGYVGDSSLLDPETRHNVGALALADAAYRLGGGGSYHTCIHGPMLVLGVTRSGASTSVPEAFLSEFLPALATGAPS